MAINGSGPLRPSGGTGSGGNGSSGGGSGGSGSGGSSGSGQNGSGPTPIPSPGPVASPTPETPVYGPVPNYLPGQPRTGGFAIVSGSELHLSNEQKFLLIGGLSLLTLALAIEVAPVIVTILGVVRVYQLATAALALTSYAALQWGGNYADAETTLYRNDPILLDLNGDGIKTTDMDHGVWFDHDNNGFQEWSAWVDSNDGMLVADLNNNGIIDNGTELLGNHTVLPNGSTALDGYAALADYDSNADSVINSRDQKLAA